MRQFSFVKILFALLVSGCALISGGGEEPETADSPTPSPEATATKTEKSQQFTKPVVKQKPSAGKAIPGLLKSASIPEQVKQAQSRINAAKGKRDPFSTLPSQSAASVPPPALPPRSVNPPRLPSSGGGDILPPSGPGFPPDFPAGPQPDLARAVAVTGVVKVGSQVQAIVEAPNEGTSRYVRAGQRLSNGRVLVKRIEVYEGADPVVVLEQDGVEVVRRVGEAPASASEAAVLPSSAALTSLPPVPGHRSTAQG